MTDELERYKTISTRILGLQAQLATLQHNLSHSYDDENFTVAAVAKIKREIKHQKLLLDEISKNLIFK